MTENSLSKLEMMLLHMSRLLSQGVAFFSSMEAILEDLKKKQRIFEDIQNFLVVATKGLSGISQPSSARL